jgi:hypothetical protein
VEAADQVEDFFGAAGEPDLVFTAGGMVVSVVLSVSPCSAPRWTASRCSSTLLVIRADVLERELTRSGHF